MRRQEWKISCHINKTNTVKNKEVKTQTEEENLFGINSLREEVKYKVLKQSLFADIIMNKVKHFISPENSNKKQGIKIADFKVISSWKETKEAKIRLLEQNSEKRMT